MPYIADPSAIIDTGATIGQDSRIWHFSHICAGAHIGSHCSIGQNVFISNDVQIGNRVKIQNNVSVYDAVVLEDDVFCGPSMVFTNVHNPRAFINRKHEYRKTHVQQGATLGANCTVVCGVTIGRYAFIGAGAVVTKDVPDYALIAGVPGKQLGWVSQYGHRLQFDSSGYAQCPESGQQYQLHQHTVRTVSIDEN